MSFITTALLLHLLLAVILRGSSINLLGLEIPTFPILPSALFVVVWTLWRSSREHREVLSAPAFHAFIRQSMPELLVAALFLVGLVLRLWGIGFGGPLIIHPDEHQVAGVSVQLLKQGSLSPPTPFHYPMVFPYLLLPGFAWLYMHGKAAGTWTSLNDISTQTFEFYELARAHSAVLGALTIVLTYILARRMWPGRHGRWTGVVAATFLTFSFNHVKESHFAVTDAALTFFVVLAFIAIHAAVRRGTPASYALAGFAIGIACATKYSAAPLVVVLVVGHFLNPLDRWTPAAWRRLAFGLALIPVGFVVGHPYALLNWPAILEHVGRLGRMGSDEEFDAGSRFHYMASYSSESGFGLPFTLILIVAFVVAVHRRRLEDLLPVTFIVATLSLLANSSMPFYPRYLVPIVPFAALLVGTLLVESQEWLRTLPAVRFEQALLTGVVILLIAPQAFEAVQFSRLSSLPDTRAQARAYLLERFQPGARIASEAQYLRLPRGYELLIWTPLDRHSAEDFANVDALVFSSDEDRRSKSSPIDARNTLRKQFPLAATFQSQRGVAAGPTVTIYLGPNALR